MTTERERTSLQFDRYAVGTEESCQVQSSSIQISLLLTPSGIKITVGMGLDMVKVLYRRDLGYSIGTKK